MIPGSKRILIRRARKLLDHYIYYYKAKKIEKIPERWPEFLCIGGRRCGTTWLHNQLSRHPDIYLHRKKEIHFFDNDAWWQKHIFSGLDDPIAWRWYSLHFARAESFQFKGDITPAYAIIPEETVSIIAEKLPNVKIIYIMRNPLERTWSSIRKSMYQRTGLTPGDRDFSEKMFESIDFQTISVPSNYKKTILLWEKYFSAEQILYLFFDDIRSDGAKILSRVCSFIGADQLKLSSVGRKKSSSPPNSAPQGKIPDEIRARFAEETEEQINFLGNKFNRDLRHWSCGM